MEKIYNNKMDVENISFRCGLVDSPEASIILKSTNMQQEIWKDIPNYEGYYQVSNLGRVKSLSREILNQGKFPFISKEKILKERISKNGYNMIYLCKNGKLRNISVHIMVAMAFLNHIPDGTNKICVDHINNNSLDNRLENLQLITQRENSSKDKKNKTSKYTGVCWDKKRNKWKGYIEINKERKYLGYFTDEYEAHLAYQNQLKKII